VGEGVFTVTITSLSTPCGVSIAGGTVNVVSSSVLVTVTEASLIAGKIVVDGGVEGSVSAFVKCPFTDPNSLETSSAYTTSVNFGDGFSTTGIVTGSGGAFLLTASHTYLEEGLKTVTCTITDESPNTITLTAQVFVGDAGITFTPQVQAPVAFGTMASLALGNLADLDLGDDDDDYIGTVVWSDGSTDPLTFTGSGATVAVHDSHTFTAPGTFTGQVFIHDNGGANATGTVTICVQDECAVCGGNHCSCTTGILNGNCKTPLTCSGAQNNQACCSGTNAASVQCTAAQGGGGDLIQTTNNERCLSGVCVGCIAGGVSGFPTFNLCGGSNSFGFLTSADSSTVKGLCAAMTRTTFGNQPAVQITSWSIAHGPLLFAASGVDQAYLNQFLGTFTFTVGAKIIILTCVPTANGPPCLVSNIYISTDPTFCYAEFVVSSSSQKNAIVGGSLLSPNPFH